MSNDAGRPHKSSPLEPRQLWISAAMAVAAIPAAYFLTGPFWPYFLLFSSFAMASRGIWPDLFGKHIEKQPIAGIEAQRKESVRSWLLATLTVLVLSMATTVLHYKVRPPHLYIKCDPVFLPIPFPANTSIRLLTPSTWIMHTISVPSADPTRLMPLLVQ